MIIPAVSKPFIAHCVCGRPHRDSAVTAAIGTQRVGRSIGYSTQFVSTTPRGWVPCVYRITPTSLRNGAPSSWDGNIRTSPHCETRSHLKLGVQRCPQSTATRLAVTTASAAVVTYLRDEISPRERKMSPFSRKVAYVPTTFRRRNEPLGKISIISC